MSREILESCLYRLPVGRVLAFIERESGKPFPCVPGGRAEAGRWHRVIREGIKARLHLNVGIPGAESPEHPVEEHASALWAALLLGRTHVEVILSGDWEEAVRKGLLTRQELGKKQPFNPSATGLPADAGPRGHRPRPSGLT